MCGLSLVAWENSKFPNRQDQSETWSPEVIVTSDDTREWPDGCHPGDVAERLIGFFMAFNAGDQQRLPDFFNERFNWFSVTLQKSEQEIDHFLAYSRSDLFAYFAEQHQQGEQWRLYTVQVNGLVDGEYVNIQYELGRVDDDVPEQSVYLVGKGAFRCTSQTVFVWSAGTFPYGDGSPTRFDCPLPMKEISVGNTVIACSG
jgi:hypothetical protein